MWGFEITKSPSGVQEELSGEMVVAKDRTDRMVIQEIVILGAVRADRWVHKISLGCRHTRTLLNNPLSRR